MKLTDAVAVGAANSMVYAVMNDRTVKYWSYGSSPTSLIKGESASTSDLFENALEVTGGISHNTILRDDGYVWTWSNGGAEAGNASGQLGNTLRKYLNYPALVVVGESPYNSVYLNNVVEVRSVQTITLHLLKNKTKIIHSMTFRQIRRLHLRMVMYSHGAIIQKVNSVRQQLNQTAMHL